jgi:hypothetical protein
MTNNDADTETKRDPWIPVTISSMSADMDDDKVVAMSKQAAQ